MHRHATKRRPSRTEILSVANIIRLFRNLRITVPSRRAQRIEGNGVSLVITQNKVHVRFELVFANGHARPRELAHKCVVIKLGGTSSTRNRFGGNTYVTLPLPESCGTYNIELD